MPKTLERRQEPDRCPSCGTPVSESWCSYCARSISEADLAAQRSTRRIRGTQSIEPFPEMLNDGAGVTVTILEQIDAKKRT